MKLLSGGHFLSLLSRRFTDTSKQTWGLGAFTSSQQGKHVSPTHGIGLGVSKFSTDVEHQL